MPSFTPDADRWRFYEDGSESGSSPAGGEDANVTRMNATDNQVHLRYRVQETAGVAGASTDDYTLQYQVDGAGGWTTITAASSRVQADTGSTLTDGSATTNRGTNGIADGTGSFVAGEQEDGDGEITDHQLTASNFTEHVWALLLIAADNANGETLHFRMRLNGGAMGNTVEPVITIQKPFTQAVGGTLSFAGNLTRKLTAKRSVGGTLSFAGDLTKKTKKPLGGALSFAGALAKKVLKPVGGTLSFAGALTRRLTAKRSVGGTLSFAGDLSKKIKKPVGGTLSFAGALAKKISKPVGGVLSFGGSLVANFISGSGTLYFQAVGGVLSFSGALTKKTKKPLGGALSFAGALTKKILKPVGGTLSFAGALTKKTFKSVGGTLTFSGALTKKTKKLVGGTLSFIGGIFARLISGGAPDPTWVNGPWLMHTRDTFTNIWVQSTLSAMVTATIFQGGRRIASFNVVVDGTSGIGVIAVTGLTADTIYTYTLDMNGIPVAGSWTFRTMPTTGNPGRFRVSVESDHHISEGWGAAKETLVNDFYQAISDLQDRLPPLPTLTITPGDHEAPTATDTATRRTQMQTIRSLGFPSGARTNWRGKTPLYSVWDDWDYLGNNSAGQAMTAAQRLAAETVFREYYAGHSTMESSEGIHRAFQIADVAFILCDNRTYREATLGTTTPATVDPWDYTASNDAWGAAQLAWIKAQLTAAKDLPIKILVTGCNLMDNVRTGSGGGGRRDSIGIYHRRERNDLFQFLKDNPDEARGLLVIKGDDHIASAHIESQFREPEPFTDSQGRATPAASWPDKKYANIVQVCANVVSNPALHTGWFGHPGERFFIRGPSGNSRQLIIDIDTASSPTTMHLRWFATTEKQFLYEAFWREGEWHFPVTEYHSVAGQGGIEDGSFSPDAEPSDTWTPDAEP
jgi:hypothetical protein